MECPETGKSFSLQISDVLDISYSVVTNGGVREDHIDQRNAAVASGSVIAGRDFYLSAKQHTFEFDGNRYTLPASIDLDVASIEQYLHSQNSF